MHTTMGFHRILTNAWADPVVGEQVRRNPKGALSNLGVTGESLDLLATKLVRALSLQPRTAQVADEQLEVFANTQNRAKSNHTDSIEDCCD